MAKRGVHVGRQAILLLVLRYPHVGVGGERGVNADAIGHARHVRNVDQRFFHRRSAVAKVALVSLQARQGVEHLLPVGLPRGPIGIKFGQVPVAIGRRAGSGGLRQRRPGGAGEGKNGCEGEDGAAVGLEHACFPGRSRANAR